MSVHRLLGAIAAYLLIGMAFGAGLPPDRPLGTARLPGPGRANRLRHPRTAARVLQLRRPHVARVRRHRAAPPLRALGDDPRDPGRRPLSRCPARLPGVAGNPPPRHRRRTLTSAVGAGSDERLERGQARRQRGGVVPPAASRGRACARDAAPCRRDAGARPGSRGRRRSGSAPIRFSIADTPTARRSPSGAPVTARRWFSNWLVSRPFDRPVPGVVDARRHLVGEQPPSTSNSSIASTPT